MAEKRTGLALSNDICNKLSKLCEELYNEMPWKHAIAGVIFAAAEFACSSSLEEEEPKYHDRAILLADRFEVRADCLPRVQQGLDCVLGCMDCAHVETAEPGQRQSPSQQQVLVSVHGYVPAKQGTKPPQVPNTPGIYKSSLPCWCSVRAQPHCWRLYPVSEVGRWCTKPTGQNDCSWYKWAGVGRYKEHRAGGPARSSR